MAATGDITGWHISFRVVLGGGPGVVLGGLGDSKKAGNYRPQDHPGPRKGNPVHAFDVEILFGIITGVQYRVVGGFLFKIFPEQKRVTGFFAEACEPALLVY